MLHLFEIFSCTTAVVMEQCMQKSYERNNNFYAAVVADGTSMQKDRSPLSDTNFRLQAVQAICIGERLFFSLDSEYCSWMSGQPKKE